MSHEPTVSASQPSNPPPGVESVPNPDLSMSVEDAYAAIPHRRTEMNFATSKLSEADRSYLAVAFSVIDQSIRLRVTAYRTFSESPDANLISEMDRMIVFMQKVEPPARLSAYHELLISALRDQRAFFAEWQSAGPQFQYGSPGTIASHPKVQSASQALSHAYQILMNEYSGEDSHNQDAFFDYHCALDFL
ncbi:MAG TPA: hypothetical protein VE961_09330 [Pyrinomonadaceae bacterium]|nr:hypothetical protein [Pyrinomonadaceae bacterium]